MRGESLWRSRYRFLLRVMINTLVYLLSMQVPMKVMDVYCSTLMLGCSCLETTSVLNAIGLIERRTHPVKNRCVFKIKLINEIIFLSTFYTARKKAFKAQALAI